MGGNKNWIVVIVIVLVIGFIITLANFLSYFFGEQNIIFANLDGTYTTVGVLTGGVSVYFGLRNTINDKAKTVLSQKKEIKALQNENTNLKLQLRGGERENIRKNH